MTAAAAASRIAEFWDQAIVPTLVEYIRIPAKSPQFDAEWRAHGHIEAAVGLAERWCGRYAVPGMKLEVLRLPGRTPLLLLEIPATRPDLETVILYGHLDKQPEMAGWRAGLGPSLGRRERGGGLELPPGAPAARAHGGGGLRRHQAGPVSCADPAAAQRASQGSGQDAGRRDLAQVSVRAGHEADVRRPGR